MAAGDSPGSVGSALVIGLLLAFVGVAVAGNFWGLARFIRGCEDPGDPVSVVARVGFGFFALVGLWLVAGSLLRLLADLLR
jgi:hypothetical protein